MEINKDVNEYPNIQIPPSIRRVELVVEYSFFFNFALTLHTVAIMHASNTYRLTQRFQE